MFFLLSPLPTLKLLLLLVVIMKLKVGVVWAELRPQRR